MPIVIAPPPEPTYKRSALLGLKPRRVELIDDGQRRKWNLGVLVVNPDDLVDLDTTAGKIYNTPMLWLASSTTGRNASVPNVDELVKLPAYARQQLQLVVRDGGGAASAASFSFPANGPATVEIMGGDPSKRNDVLEAARALVASARPRHTTAQLLRGLGAGGWAFAVTLVVAMWVLADARKSWPVLAVVSILVGIATYLAVERVQEQDLTPWARRREGLRVDPQSAADRRNRRNSMRDNVKLAIVSAVIGIVAGYLAARLGVG